MRQVLARLLNRSLCALCHILALKERNKVLPPNALSCAHMRNLLSAQRDPILLADIIRKLEPQGIRVFTGARNPQSQPALSSLVNPNRGNAPAIRQSRPVYNAHAYPNPLHNRYRQRRTVIQDVRYNNLVRQAGPELSPFTFDPQYNQTISVRQLPHRICPRSPSVQNPRGTEVRSRRRDHSRAHAIATASPYLLSCVARLATISAAATVLSSDAAAL